MDKKKIGCRLGMYEYGNKSIIWVQMSEVIFMPYPF